MAHRPFLHNILGMIRVEDHLEIQHFHPKNTDFALFIPQQIL
jgi:hypothetical protein